MGTEKKFKILVVDDEPEILDIVGDEFREAGMEAEVAKSSHDAIKKIESTKFNAVVSDYKMEGGTGFEILDYIEKMGDQHHFFSLCRLLPTSRWGNSPIGCRELYKAL